MASSMTRVELAVWGRHGFATSMTNLYQTNLLISHFVSSPRLEQVASHATRILVRHFNNIFRNFATYPKITIKHAKFTINRVQNK